MGDTNRSKITMLELVFPPISNQEAFLLRGQPAAEYMRESDFYMIGGKRKSKFVNIEIDSDYLIKFDLLIGDEKSGNGEIDVLNLGAIIDFEGDFKLAYNEDSIELQFEKDGEYSIIERLTPENILWHRSRNKDGIHGLDNYRDLMVYDLLYVGIAKIGDSYERLIEKGHHARLNILANEPQRHPGARVTDETFLFLFKLEPLYITSFGAGDEIDLDFGYIHKQIVADAEKAFVSLLQPNYNVVRFEQYPKGKDGLFNSKLNNYSYSIGDAFTFNTPHGKIKGDRDNSWGGLSNKADFIFVDKESSKLFVSGVDFESDI